MKRINEQIALKELGSRIETLLEQFVHHMSAEHNRQDDEEYYCDYLQQYLWPFTKACLWPRAARPSRLYHLLARIHSFDVPPSVPSSDCPACNKSVDALRKFSTEISKLKGYAKFVAAGVCLDCFKAGGNYDRACRTPHKKGEGVAYYY